MLKVNVLHLKEPRDSESKMVDLLYRVMYSCAEVD